MFDTAQRIPAVALIISVIVNRACVNFLSLVFSLYILPLLPFFLNKKKLNFDKSMDHLYAAHELNITIFGMHDSYAWRAHVWICQLKELYRYVLGMANDSRDDWSVMWLRHRCEWPALKQSVFKTIENLKSSIVYFSLICNGYFGSRLKNGESNKYNKIHFFPMQHVLRPHIPIKLLTREIKPKSQVPLTSYQPVDRECKTVVPKKSKLITALFITEIHWNLKIENYQLIVGIGSVK